MFFFCHQDETDGPHKFTICNKLKEWTLTHHRLKGSFFWVFFHTHCNLPWCLIHCWSLPSCNITWFSTLAGLFLLFTWNLGNDLGWSVVLVGISGKTSSRNCSATSPSSSTRRRLAYHFKPWIWKNMPRINKHAIIAELTNMPSFQPCKWQKPPPNFHQKQVL